MITLKRLNVVRQVESDEKAAKLEAQGFKRTGGSAEGADKGKGAKGSKKDDPKPDDKKEGNDGGSNQQDSGDGSK